MIENRHRSEMQVDETEDRLFEVDTESPVPGVMVHVDPMVAVDFILLEAEYSRMHVDPQAIEDNAALRDLSPMGR